MPSKSKPKPDRPAAKKFLPPSGHNVFSAKGEGYSLERAAKLAGISEGLLILWITTERFTPVELDRPDDLDGRDCPFQYRRFVITDANLRDLRKLVEKTRAVATEHKTGSNWTLKELADATGFSTDTIRDWFQDEAGILVLERPETRKKRGYKTFTIPEAVAERVLRRRTQ